MKTEHRIYAAIAILLALAGGWYATNQKKQKDIAAHSAPTSTTDLPTIAVSKDDVEAITKLEVKNADKSSITLEKKGDGWELTAPVKAKANAANVRSLLDNLKDLKVKESIDRGTGTYKQYELDDEKGVHVTAFKGDGKIFDGYFGKSGSRGQLARIGGKDGVWVVNGYSPFLYTREVKNWRETSILKFEDANVIQASVTNPNGLFSFSQNDGKWSGSYKTRQRREAQRQTRKEVGEVRRRQGQGDASCIQVLDGGRLRRRKIRRGSRCGRDKRWCRSDQAEGQRWRHHGQGWQDKQGHEPFRCERRRRRHGLCHLVVVG